MQKVGGPLHMGGNAEDRALVFLQNFEPALNIGRMVSTRLRRQFQTGTQEPDIPRAGELLGWSPTVELQEGLKKKALYFEKAVALLGVQLGSQPGKSARRRTRANICDGCGLWGRLPSKG